MQPTEPYPLRNARSRASVRYRFTVPANGSVLIENDADFADVLTVYGGSNLATSPKKAATTMDVPLSELDRPEDKPIISKSVGILLLSKQLLCAHHQPTSCTC